MFKIDFNELKKYADNLKKNTFTKTIDLVAMTMMLGSKKYPKEDWKERSIEHHLEHIFDHLDNFKADPSLKKLEDLTHATCRCMMLCEKIIGTQNGNTAIPRGQEK